MARQERSSALRTLPRNVWAVSVTSFLTDISSEMIISLLPLFLAGVLGVKTGVIGLIEGIAETTASLLKIASGWLSDRLGQRKWLAVSGYGFSALAKPLFYFVTSWWGVLALRFADRVGKGIRTSPRDALVADSISAEHRGLAFGLHRAADTGGAMIGLLIALGVVWAAQSGTVGLARSTFQTVVLISFVPAALAVLTLALGARDVQVFEKRAISASVQRMTLSSAIHGPFKAFLFIVVLFTLGNSSDAFLILRAKERGLSVVGVLAMVATFNGVYALVSGPAGVLSDWIGRRRLIVGGWLMYGLIYLGFAVARSGWQVWALYAVYGVYYGMSEGTAKALVADLVAPEQRGTGYGLYNAAVGITVFPASLIAGLLWQGIGAWDGFGPSAPFLFGATLALVAAALMWCLPVPPARAGLRHGGSGMGAPMGLSITGRWTEPRRGQAGMEAYAGAATDLRLRRQISLQLSNEPLQRAGASRDSVAGQAQLDGVNFRLIRFARLDFGQMVIEIGGLPQHQIQLLAIASIDGL